MSKIILKFALVSALISVCTAGIPPVSEFVSGSDFSTPDADIVNNINSELTQYFGNGPAVCGDNICDISRQETCLTCPEDCGGPCKLGSPIEKCVKENHYALTFDDGPSEYTMDVLRVLKKKKIKATFFVNGVHAIDEDKAEVLKAVYDAGHVIGSHTFSHRSLETGKGSSDRQFDSLEYDHMMGEVFVNDAVISKVIGKNPLFLRPPYLEYSKTSMAFMETAGYTPVNINVDTNDWQCKKKCEVLKNTRRAFRSAQSDRSWIHLQHDSLEHSVKALPKIIDHLRSHKVKFVTMDVCLGTPAYREDDDFPFLSRHVLDPVETDYSNKEGEAGSVLSEDDDDKFDQPEAECKTGNSDDGFCGTSEAPVAAATPRTVTDKLSQASQLSDSAVVSSAQSVSVPWVAVLGLVLCSVLLNQ